MIQFSDIFTTLDVNPCVVRCLRMEYSKFGKQCKKRKGYFKCCITVWRLDTYENTRNELIEEGILKEKKTSFCKKTKSGKSTCHFCSMTGICSKKHPITGSVVNTYFNGNKSNQEGNLIHTFKVSLKMIDF